MNEPRMRVRDRDLRRIIFNHGAGPGTPLYEALAELQRYRDEAHEDEDAEAAEAGPGHHPAAQGPRTSPLL